MTIVELDKELAEDLIQFKLRRIQEESDLILTRWNETSPQTFMDKARDGTYINAENDAIDLHQLVADAHKLRETLRKIG